MTPDLAALTVRIIECDSAATNISAIATSDVLLPARIIQWIGYCLLHQLHIVSGFVLQLASNRGHALSYVSSLFCLAKLLRTPGYFWKLLDNISKCVGEHLFIYEDVPPLGARAYNIELLQFFGFSLDRCIGLVIFTARVASSLLIRCCSHLQSKLCADYSMHSSVCVI